MYNFSQVESLMNRMNELKMMAHEIASSQHSPQLLSTLQEALSKRAELDKEIASLYYRSKEMDERNKLKRQVAEERKREKAFMTPTQVRQLLEANKQQLPKANHILGQMWLLIILLSLTIIVEVVILYST